jgi:hypothetical protein
VGGLHLVAYALGAGAIGMRFLDSEVLDLLGEPDDLVMLLFTCVAVPEYASRRTRSPGRRRRLRGCLLAAYERVRGEQLAAQH